MSRHYSLLGKPAGRKKKKKHTTNKTTKAETKTLTQEWQICDSKSSLSSHLPVIAFTDTPQLFVLNRMISESFF